MRKSLFAMLLLLALLVPVLAACGQSTPAAAPTAAAAPTTAAAPTAAEAPTSAPAPTAAEQPTSAPAATAAEAPTSAAAPTAAEQPTTATAGGGKKIKVGLVTDVGKVNDGTFNQYAYEGLKRAESELGVEIAFIETQAQTDYEKNMEQFASQGFDMIIGVGFLMGDALKANAAKHPNI
jgi:basic membrane protein A